MVEAIRALTGWGQKTPELWQALRGGMWSCFKDPSLQPALNGPAEQSNCAAWLRGVATELQRQHEEHAAALLRGSCEGREEDAPMAAYFVGWFGGADR